LQEFLLPQKVSFVGKSGTASIALTILAANLLVTEFERRLLDDSDDDEDIEDEGQK
jgi:hypothetical protein